LDSFVNAVVAICAELDGFIRDNTTLDIVQIMEICSVNSFDFWRIISSFAKAVKGIPAVLKRHLFELEINLMFNLVWNKNSPLIDFIRAQTEGFANLGFSPTNAGDNSTKISDKKESVKKEDAMDDQISQADSKKTSENDNKKITLSHE